MPISQFDEVSKITMGTRSDQTDIGAAGSPPAQEREAQRLYELRVMIVDQIAAALGSSPSTA